VVLLAAKKLEGLVALNQLDERRSVGVVDGDERC